MVPVPESPDDLTIKPVLMALPRPPMFPVLRADVPNRNGFVYPQAVVEKACEQAQQMVRNGTLLVQIPHERGEVDLLKVIGVVKHAELEGGQMMVEVKFVEGPLKFMKSVSDLLHWSVNGTGHINGNRVESMDVHSIYATLLPDMLMPHTLP